MIRIAHISDTHNKPGIVRQVADVAADIIVISGDCIKSQGRYEGVVDPAAERCYQDRWARHQAERWAKDIGSRPVVTVGGNHDFVSLAKWLAHFGVEVHEITDDNPCVEVKGIRFAGFRQVPYIAGEWMGETHDMAPHVERAMACDPQVLVTHAPPAGILDSDEAGDGGYGVQGLTSYLCYQPHNITHHFFGHAHSCGGHVVDEMGVRFINGAGHCIVHEVG